MRTGYVLRKKSEGLLPDYYRSNAGVWGPLGREVSIFDTRNHAIDCKRRYPRRFAETVSVVEIQYELHIKLEQEQYFLTV